MTEAGPADTDLATLRLMSSSGLAEQRPEAADLARSIDGASTLTLRYGDPRRKLLKAPQLRERTTVSIDGRLFELVGTRKQGSTLTATFEDAAAADLRRVTRTAAVRAGTTTRVGYARRIVGAVGWLSLAGPAGPAARVQFVQDGGTDPETGWDALARLFVTDLRWRRFIDGRQVVLAPDPWLYARRPAVVLREHSGGVDDIDFNTDAGKLADRATVRCAAARWTVPPGAPVQIPDFGPGSGAWLVETIDRSLFNTSATIGLVRVAQPLPPPKPAPRDDGTPTARSSQSSEAGGAVDAGPVSARGYVWPVTGRLTSGFGQRSGRLHAGVDVAVPIGTPVAAAAAGTVTVAGSVGGYGVAVYLDHGSTITRYGHLSKVLVRAGQQVGRGERIALSGNTGNSTGPHLHFELRPGDRPVDPLPFLPTRR